MKPSRLRDLRKLLVLIFPPLALAALFAAFLALPAAGCTPAQKTGIKVAAKSLIDCEKVNLEAIVDHQGGTLLGRAADILIEGGTGWQGYLEDLGVELGEMSLACAVEAVRAGLVAARPRFEIAPESGVARARDFIAAHGWQYKQ